MKPAPRKNIKAVLSLLKRNGYKIYDKPYELNIVGVRKDTTLPNQFDDRLYVIWKNDKNKMGRQVVYYHNRPRHILA